MSKTTADLNAKLATGNRFAALNVNDQLAKWKTVHFEKFCALTGSKEAAEKIFVICMNTIAKNPDLLLCTFESLANCVLQSFQLNLFPGPFSECAYVPLRNGRASTAGRDVREANFWVQYPGLIKLLRNAGNRAVIARVVCEGDGFEYAEGDRAPKFTPACVLGNPRGGPRFAYAAVCTAQGFWQVEVMDLDQLNDIKSRSRGAGKSDSPWNSRFVDDVYAMMAKTVLKRVAKWCTKSADLVSALEQDNAVDNEESLLVAPPKLGVLSAPEMASLPNPSEMVALDSEMVDNATVPQEL